MLKVAASFIILFLIQLTVFSQEVNFSSNKSEFQIGETLILKVQLTGTEKSDVSSFDQIPGFAKRGRSTSHSNITVEGVKTLQHTIEQKYIAVENGRFQTDSICLNINNLAYCFPPLELTVGNDSYSKIDTTSSINLYLYVNKSEVKVGEGLKVSLGLYVPQSNTVNYDFSPRFNTEVQEIIRKLEPSDCFINRKNISTINAESVKFFGEPYFRYNVYEAVIYPIIEKEIVFPSVGLTVIETNSSKSDSSINQILRSNSFKVKALPLPQHPTKNTLSVGQLKMRSSFEEQSINTGKIYQLPVTITGKTNFKTLQLKTPINDSYFDFYPPEIEEVYKDGSEQGSKTFTFKIFPKKSHNANLGDYFSLIYFNTSQEKYDTLKLSSIVNITGSEVKGNESLNNSIYENIENIDITSPNRNFRLLFQNVANILLFLALATIILNIYLNKRPS